jgi:GAF domain-containing protein
MDKAKIVLAVKSILALIFIGAFGFSITSLDAPSQKLSIAVLAGGISGILVVIISYIQASISNKNISNAKQQINDQASSIEELEKLIEDSKKMINDSKIQAERIDTLSKIFQDADDIKLASSKILDSIANDIEICQGVLYISEEDEGVKKLVGAGTYAYHKLESEIDSPQFGVGLVGQTAQEKKALYINELPSGYIDVVSGLGKSKPNYLALLPLIYSDNVLGVLEIASFTEFTQNDKDLFDKLQESLGAGIHFLNQTKLLESLNNNNTLTSNSEPIIKIEEEIQTEEVNTKVELIEPEENEEEINDNINPETND